MGDSVSQHQSESKPEKTPEAFDGLNRVLVAEDEHLVAVNLQENLQTLGLEVIGPVTNGQQAVELARTEKPDIALLDIRMPVMDGLEAAGVLYRQMNIPVVIVSAFSDSDYMEQGARIGVFGYLLKPVTTDELRVNLAVAWSRFRKHKELSSQVEDLKLALEDRKLIERAKGLIMDKLGLSESEAMRRLQKQARDSRRRLPDLARAILEAQQLLGQPKDSSKT
jgi:response regulator NasT